MNLQLLFKKSIICQYITWISIAVIIIILINYLCSVIIRRFRSLGKSIDNRETEQCNSNVKENEIDEYIPALGEIEHIRYEGATIKLQGGAQAFYEMIQNRRSVRAFKSHPIPSIHIINTCIKAAGTSPSGAHTEPWTFCIVSNSHTKQCIRDVIEFEEEQNYKHRMSRQWTADLRPLKTNYIKPYLTDAPYLIVIFKQIYGLLNSGKRKQHYYNEISVSISTGILLCALQSAGLSTLVTTPLNCGAKLRNLLNRPINEKLLFLLPVGYPADNCEVPNLKRKPLEDIIVRY